MGPDGVLHRRILRGERRPAPPDRFAAAASLSGYFQATTDATTGNLYRGSTADRNANSPLWLVSHANPKSRLPYLYLAASAGDPVDVAAIGQLTKAAPANAPLQIAILLAGGHNFRVWRTLAPAALDWLSGHLSPPLAPPLTASPSG